MLAALNPQFWWYLARSSGIVAWMLLALPVLWGLMVASRMIPLKTAPKWLLDMHRFLGGLAVSFTLVHIAALVADSYLYFGWREVLVPFASAYEPGAVAWGVVGVYLLLAVELTSLAMRRLPRRWWRAVHMSSYAVFVLTTVHGLFAGTDARNVFFVMTVSMLIGVNLFALVYRIATTRRFRKEAVENPRIRRVGAADTAASATARAKAQ